MMFSLSKTFVVVVRGDRRLKEKKKKKKKSFLYSSVDKKKKKPSLLSVKKKKRPTKKHPKINQKHTQNRVVFFNRKKYDFRRILGPKRIPKSIKKWSKVKLEHLWKTWCQNLWKNMPPDRARRGFRCSVSSNRKISAWSKKLSKKYPKVVPRDVYFAAFPHSFGFKFRSKF